MLKEEDLSCDICSSYTTADSDSSRPLSKSEQYTHV